MKMSHPTIQLHTVSQSLSVASSWQMQFAAVSTIVASFATFFLWNYFYLSSPMFCTAEPVPAWTNVFTFLVVGATSGTCLQLWFRTIISMTGFAGDRLRHPYATWLVLFISSTQALTQIANQIGFVPYTCVDFLGIKTHALLWWEWLTTVPFMFFLVSIMDVKRNSVTSTDIWIEVLGGSSIFALFLCNLPLSRALCWALFIYSNTAITVALLWQQYIAMDEYTTAREEIEAFRAKNPDMDFPPRKLYDQLKVSQCKMNASIFMSVFFTLFPIWYYLQVFGYIDEGVFIVLTYSCSYLAKVLFLQIIGDSHVEILDPNKFLLVEERKKAEESRLMFLRYVFHEVRVPLNSISLGLQLLEDSAHLMSQDLDMIKMMKEATTFMSETLNDVLSLQKMEQGMLELEVKPFAPVDLVQSVLGNFRAQSEAKHIQLDYLIAGDVPTKILGDQFRLEHVLGNLLSNAIKFSDPDSRIHVAVTYGTENRDFVTFSVEDEGIGMSEEDQKLLFQPFMQIRPGELQKGRGSGLGLSICKNIIELHQGHIGCRSKQRVGADRSTGGSTFYFSLEYDGARVEKCLAAAAAAVASKTPSSPSRASTAGTADRRAVEVSPPAPLARHSATASAVLSAVADEVGSALKKGRSLHTTDFVAMRTMNTRKESSNEILAHLTQSRSPSMALHKAVKASTDRETVPKVDMGDLVTGVAVAETTVPNSPSPSSPASDATTTADASLTPKDSFVSVSSVASTATQPLTVIPPPSPSQPVAPLSHLNVLIVDDVLSNRKMLDMTLRRKGFESDQAADGLEAVQTVTDHGLDHYDIIFMDSVMPNLCGPDAARRLRQLGFAKLIVGVTGNAMDVDVNDFESAGADVVLTKPMRVDALTNVLTFCQEKGCISHFNRTVDPSDRLKTWVQQQQKK